jgi:hypothetical protein
MTGKPRSTHFWTSTIQSVSDNAGTGYPSAGTPRMAKLCEDPKKNEKAFYALAPRTSTGLKITFDLSWLGLALWEAIGNVRTGRKTEAVFSDLDRT